MASCRLTPRQFRFAALLIWQIAIAASAIGAPWTIAAPDNQGNLNLWDYAIGPDIAFHGRKAPVAGGGIVGIDTAPDGSLYLLTTFSDNGLYKVERTTGAALRIGATGINVVEGDIGFDPTTGILYALTTGPATQHQLMTVDLATGNATLVGPLGGVDDPSGLAFDPTGNLWVMNANGNTTKVADLLRVNKANGQVLETYSTGVETGSALGMDFAGDKLFVAARTGYFYSVDLASGAMIERGFTLVSAFGLAFFPDPETADFDGDGEVSGVDFLTWQRGFGATGGASHKDGDANHDQAVDFNDFLAWQQQFGGGLTAKPSYSTVPEPESLILGALWAAQCVGTGRRVRRAS